MAYLAGSIDMLSYQAVLDGNRERGQCIADALYRDDKLRATEGILDAAARYPDKDPVILIIAVMEQVCGK